MDKPVFEESFLITKDDYINMSVDKERLSVSGKRKVLLYAAGIAAVCVGVLLLLNFRESFYHSLCWVALIVLGLYCISYYEVISPAMTRAQAGRFYDVFKGSIHSRTVRLFEDKIEIISEERKIRIPKDRIYKISEGKNTFLIYTDERECVFIPKRTISSDALKQTIVSFSKLKNPKIILYHSKCRFNCLSFVKDRRDD